MAHKTIIGGTAYGITGGKTLIGGTAYSIKKGKTLIGGTAYDINFQNGTPVSGLPTGSIVLIPENGVDVEFRVSCHDYESGLNGSGRTLLIRNTAYYENGSDGLVWSNGTSDYSESLIDSWFNSSYKSQFPSAIQALMGSTKFYYSGGWGDKIVNTMSRAVFTFSVTEAGITHYYSVAEGTALPSRPSYSQEFWTRTGCDTTSGSSGFSDCAVAITRNSNATPRKSYLTNPVFPCFTLPSNTKFDVETNQIII